MKDKTITLKQPTEKSLSPIKGQITKNANIGDKLVINNDEDMDKANTVLVNIKTYGKEVKKMKQTFTDPIKALQKATKTMFGDVEEALKISEHTVKSKMSEYAMKQEAARQQEERELQERMKAEEMTPSQVVAAVSDIEESVSDKPLRSKSGGSTSFRTSYEAHITDVDKVSREYYIIDEKRLKADAIDAHKRGQTVEGVTVNETKTPVVRT